MQHIVLDVVVLKVVHHVCAVALHLLIGGDGTKHDLCEALSSKHAEADPSNGPVVLDECQCAVLPDGGMKEGCLCIFYLITYQ